MSNEELLETFTEWARQVADRADIPMGVRQAATGLQKQGLAALAAQPDAPAFDWPDVSPAGLRKMAEIAAPNNGAVFRAAADEIERLAAQPVAQAPAPFIHKKTGGKYQFVGNARLQSANALNDMAYLVVYRGEDGKLWARASDEFTERFHQEGRPSRMLCDDFLEAEAEAGGVLAISPELHAVMLAAAPSPVAQAPELTDEQINQIWSAKDAPTTHKSTLSPFGLERIRAILAAAAPSPEASKPVQAEAPSEPMRAHIEQFATRAGWKMEEGEGAFEFVQRKCYQQGWIDHGTKSRDREDDTSASQDQGPDTGRVSGESGPAAEQHNEHRTGQSGADREHDQRDCRGAGLHGASNLPPQVAQKPDFIYNGERGRDAEDLLDGYNHGTAFYASPVLLRIDRAIEPLTSGEIRALMAKHGIAFANINTVEALVRDVELEHGRGVANPQARAALAAQPLEQKPVGYVVHDKHRNMTGDRAFHGMRIESAFQVEPYDRDCVTPVYAGPQPEQVAQDRFERAMKETWQMIDPLRPPPAGTYALGEHNGIAAALKTLRENYDRAARASGQEGCRHG